jgi:hypothetical protein
MEMLAPFVPTLAVAAIYCVWFRTYLKEVHKSQRLRERVAYMLWCAAHEAE